MPVCIYCTEEKGEALFNRDHVIPEAFGTFDDNFVLTCVCRACNQFFGDGIETELARDSLEGHDRARVGLVEASEFKFLGKRTTSYLEYDAASLPGVGPKGYLVPPKEGREFATAPFPNVGFASSEAGPFEWYSLDKLPSKAYLKQHGLRHVRTRGEADLEDFRKALAARCIEFTVTSEFDQPKGMLEAELVYNLARPQLRAMTKICFNYLARVAGSDVARAAHFDGVRRYIRHGEGAQPIEPPPKGKAEPSRCHYLSAQTVGDMVMAHLSLFMRVRYYEVTLAPSGFTSPIASAHFFDLDARKITETTPLAIA